MQMRKTFVIGSCTESALHYRKGWAVIAIDVVTASTMAITAVATGRRCYPVDSQEAAILVAARLHNPLLAGDISGSLPSELRIRNSPAELEQRSDTSRPLVLLS